MKSGELLALVLSEFPGTELAELLRNAVDVRLAFEPERDGISFTVKFRATADGETYGCQVLWPRGITKADQIRWRWGQQLQELRRHVPGPIDPV